MRTWHAELAVVGALLALAASTEGTPRAWLAAGAVLLTFAHAQVANRLDEAEGSRPRDEHHVECRRWLDRYWTAKEALWCLTFVVYDQRAALVGAVLFLLYPPWRQLWRRLHGPRAT